MKKWIIGNWKLQGSRSFLREYLEEFLVALSVGGLRELDGDALRVALCPPACYLLEMKTALAAHQSPVAAHIAVGAQNVSTASDGAFTGEVAATMARDCGAALSLIGHSERRQLFHETDEQAAEKVQTTLAAGLIPVLCVGETLVQREADQTLTVIDQQLQTALGGLSASDWSRIVVAYEPVWAIGTGCTATPQQAQTVHAFIRETLDAIQRNQSAKTLVPVSILYGGSVKDSNAAELLAQADVDGVLVGGASLNANEFARIALAAC
ncbi:MAG: triose-phosphate isomerase [Gammaproteobacteria bacterium]